MISYRNKGFKDLRMRFNPHFDSLNQAMLCPLEKGRLGGDSIIVHPSSFLKGV